MIAEQTIIYQDRQDSLIALNTKLDKTYKVYEDSLYRTTSQSKNIYVAPATKYADVALQVTKNLTDTKDKLYQLKIDQTWVDKSIRFNERNICYLSFLLPKK